MAAEQINFL